MLFVKESKSDDGASVGFPSPGLRTIDYIASTTITQSKSPSIIVITLRTRKVVLALGLKTVRTRICQDAIKGTGIHIAISIFC